MSRIRTVLRQRKAQRSFQRAVQLAPANVRCELLAATAGGTAFR